MMKASRQTKSTRNRTSTAKSTNAAVKKNGIDKGLSPSKRHREKLNLVMSELCELLPLSEDVKSGLDRLSVLKLTVSFFNTQNLMISDTMTKPHKQSRTREREATVTVNGINFSELALKAIGGFFLVLTEDGIVYYVSENVQSYLGYSQTRLMHQEFFPLVNSDDLGGLKSCFRSFMTPKSEKDHSEVFTDASGRQECFCNIKCHAGRLSSHVSPFYYKCFKLYGRIKTVSNRSTGEIKKGFFALCSPVRRQAEVCRPLSNNVEKYTCKMDAAMSNLDVDTRGLKLLCFSEKDLCGRTAYCFFHPDDLFGMSLAHEFLMLGEELSMTFRVLKGNGKWQWVRGRAYSLFNNGKLDGMVAKNVFISDEEGVYFKKQDIKDLQDRKTKNCLPSSRSNSSSLLNDYSSPNSSDVQSTDGSLPSSCGNMSPSIDEITFHSIQGGTFPVSELPSLKGKQDMLSLPTLPSKTEQSSCCVNEQSLAINDLPNFDSDTMLRIIQDLQHSFIGNMDGNLPANFQAKFGDHFKNKFESNCERSDNSHDGHFQENNDGYLDTDMMTTLAIDEMEQHVMDNGCELLDISVDHPSTATKPCCESYSKMTNKHDALHGVSRPVYCIPENGTHGLSHGVNGLQPVNNKFVIMTPSPNSYRLNTFDKNPHSDFAPLPLVEVENTLANGENSFSVTSSNMLSTTEPIAISPTYQQTSSFHGNTPMQCVGGRYDIGSALPFKGLSSTNAFKDETTVTYSGFPRFI